MFWFLFIFVIIAALVFLVGGAAVSGVAGAGLTFLGGFILHKSTDVDLLVGTVAVISIIFGLALLKLCFVLLDE